MPRRLSRSTITVVVCLAIGAGAASGGAVATASPVPAVTSAPAAQQLTRFNRLKELFFRTVRKEIIRQGLSPGVADCVVGKLRASITKKEFMRIFDGKQPRSVTRKARQAGAQCATAT